MGARTHVSESGNKCEVALGPGTKMMFVEQTSLGQLSDQVGGAQDVCGWCKRCAQYFSVRAIYGLATTVLSSLEAVVVSGRFGTVQSLMQDGCNHRSICA